MLGYFVAAAVVVWIAQTLLGLRQFKKFNNHIRDMRREGRVAIGREVKTDFSVGVRKSIAVNKIFACGEPARKILCRNVSTSEFRVYAELRRHIRANNACDVCSRRPKKFFRTWDTS